MDGWSRGWVAVTIDQSGISVSDHSTFAEVLTHAGEAVVIGVDIPIGLPGRPGRAADAAARQALSPHGRRVFTTFPLTVISEPTYEQAVARCGDGPKISRQSYGLRAKILDVRAHQDDRRIVEVHPELSFAAMSGAPLASKKTWEGAMRRRALLAQHGIELPDDLGAAGRIPVDDVLDAAAVAWSAGRVAIGAAVCLPADPPEFDGRRVAIWS